MADISISLELNDSQFQGKLNAVKGSLQNLQTSAKGLDLGESIAGGILSGAGKIIGALAGITAGITALKSAVQAGMEVESLRIRLDALTGSSETGAAALQLANDAALKLPYSLKDISNGMANLVSISPTLDMLNKRIQLTADVAAVSGLSFQEASQQLQRAMTSGIASADLFRERGVTAMLGFRNGVEYSVADSIKRIEDWGAANEGVANKLNNTLGGALSQLGDQFTRYQQAFSAAFNPALTALVNKFVESMQATSKVAQDAAFNLGVKFVDAGLVVGKVIATLIDNVVGFYRTFKPIFDFAAKLIVFFADVAVRGFGLVIDQIGRFGAAIGYITDAIGITNNLQGAMKNLSDKGFDLAINGLEGLKKQLQEGGDATFANAQGVYDARKRWEEYSESIRGAVKAAQEKRQEDSKPVPNKTPIGQPADTAATREAIKQIELLKQKLDFQKEEIKLAGENAGKSELTRQIEEARLKLENDRAQALIQAANIKDEVNRNFVIGETNRLYKDQINNIDGVINKSYELKQRVKLDQLFIDVGRATRDLNIDLQTQRDILVAASETDRRLIQNRTDARKAEQKEIDATMDKYGRMGDLTIEQLIMRQNEIAQIKATYASQRTEIEKAITEDQAYRESFTTGWQQAFNSYAENANNAAQYAGRIFSKVTQGMEDAIINFVKTGKFEFKNFLATILEELLRSQIRQLIANLFGATSTGNSGGLFGGKIIPGFLAAGGPMMPGKPYIVGERGPELVIPNTAGTVIPNNQLGNYAPTTYVTYNINAVDSSSFKQLVARDPAFLYSVTEQGKRLLPQTRR